MLSPIEAANMTRPRWLRPAGFFVCPVGMSQLDGRELSELVESYGE